MVSSKCPLPKSVTVKDGCCLISLRKLWDPGEKHLFHN